MHQVDCDGIVGDATGVGPEGSGVGVGVGPVGVGVGFAVGDGLGDGPLVPVGDGSDSCEREKMTMNSL